MADAFGSLYDLAQDVQNYAHVVTATAVEENEHAFTLLVELATYDADTWDEIVHRLDDLAREHVHAASVDLEIRVLSSAGAQD